VVLGLFIPPIVLSISDSLLKIESVLATKHMPTSLKSLYSRRIFHRRGKFFVSCASVIILIESLCFSARVSRFVSKNNDYQDKRYFWSGYSN
jgi:hypothetical protein